MNFQVTEVATSNRCSIAAGTTKCARDEVGNFNRISVLKLDVSKSSIAKITGVTRSTLYHFIATQGLKAGP